MRPRKLAGLVTAVLAATALTAPAGPAHAVGADDGTVVVGFGDIRADGTRTVQLGRVADRGGTWSTGFDLAVPYGGSNADTTFYANFIKNRQDVRVVAGTINYAERHSDYTGKWPVVAITR